MAIKKTALSFALIAGALTVTPAGSALAATTSTSAYVKQLTRACKALPHFPNEVGVASSLKQMQAELPALERYAAAMPAVDAVMLANVPSALTSTAHRLHSDYASYIKGFDQELAAIKSGKEKGFTAVILRELKTRLSTKLIGDFDTIGVYDCLRPVSPPQPLKP